MSEGSENQILDHSPDADATITREPQQDEANLIDLLRKNDGLEQKLSGVEVKLKKYEREMKGIHAEIDRAKADIDTTKTDIKEAEDTFNKSKANFIEVLGIFVALFTFVSVDVQLFRANISFLSIIGFTLLTLGGLLFFVFTLRIAMRWDERIHLGVPESVFLFTAICLVAIGAWFVYKDASHVLIQRSEVDAATTTLNSKIDGETAKLTELKECLLTGKWAKCQQ